MSFSKSTQNRAKNNELEKSVTLSVIMPFYNTKREDLKMAVDSVLSQTYKDFELILVNDGSCDDVGNFCEELINDLSFVQVVHIPNSGPSTARNIGLSYAKGKYVYFMDSDDVVEPHAFELVVAEMDKGYDMVSFNYVRENAKGQVLRQSTCSTQIIHFDNLDDKFNFLLSKFLNYEFGWEGWNRFYRKDIIDRYHISYVVNSRIGEDMCFCLCYLIHAQSYRILDKVLYHYIKREETLSAKAKKVNNFPVFESMFLYVDAFVKNSLPSMEIKRYIPACIFIIFIAMEISSLRVEGYSDKEIGSIAHKFLKSESIQLIDDFIKSKEINRVLGRGMSLKLKYDMSLILYHESYVKVLPHYILYQAYFFSRKYYYLLK